ncbi:MAG: DUF3613 domain-containing protein, partial [Nevskiales bacterium]
MKRISTLFSAALLGTMCLAASQLALAGDKAHEKVGQETRNWLELQRSGSAASETQRPMSGDVAKRSYQRYVETHSQPIPESFVDENQSFI